MKLRGKFNRILETYISKFKYHHILKIDKELDHITFFTPEGYLSEVGAYQFWEAINKKIRSFDRHDIDLKPNASN